MIHSCKDCRFSLNKDQNKYDSPLFCFNSECSQIGGHWTPCSEARHIDYGLCSPDAVYFRPKEGLIRPKKEPK